MEDIMPSEYGNEHTWELWEERNGTRFEFRQDGADKHARQYHVADDDVIWGSTCDANMHEEGNPPTSPPKKMWKNPKYKDFTDTMPTMPEGSE